MRLKNILLSAGLIAGICAAAAPAQAQPRARDACLMSARISGFDVLNDRTMIVTDTSRNRYRVRLSGICNGLSNPRMSVAFRTSSRLACIGVGDRVAFRDSIYGRQSCMVRSVQLIGGRGRAWNRDWNDRWDRDDDRRDRDNWDRDYWDRDRDR